MRCLKSGRRSLDSPLMAADRSYASRWAPRADGRICCRLPIHESCAGMMYPAYRPAGISAGISLSTPVLATLPSRASIHAIAYCCAMRNLDRLILAVVYDDQVATCACTAGRDDTSEATPDTALQKGAGVP